jgi:septal ring factor EnvC (AmiA/AmiB activator)
MRTKLVTVALASLLTIGSTAVAFAQAADAIYEHRDQMAQEMAEANRASSPQTTQSSSFASARQNHTDDSSVAGSGSSAHHRPQG